MRKSLKRTREQSLQRGILNNSSGAAGIRSSCSQGGHRRGNWLQQDPGARCRRSAAAAGDQEHRQQDPEPGNREQLQRDPLPEISQGGRNRSRVPGDLQRVPFPAATGAGDQPGQRDPLPEICSHRQQDPEQLQRDPSADDLHQDPGAGCRRSAARAAGAAAGNNKRGNQSDGKRVQTKDNCIVYKYRNIQKGI